LSWVGPMIIYKLDGQGNAILQRLDGKLLCNVISKRRLKPAYIRTKEGQIITTKTEIMTQLLQNKDPYTTELRRGLLPDYLQFEDAQGLQHTSADSLMVMTCPPKLEQNIQILTHPLPQSLHELTKEELINYAEKEQKSTFRPGEFDVIKAVFKNGILHFLLKRRYTDSKHAFYVAGTENVGCLKLLNDTINTKLRITGNPNRVAIK
jgi:hypothetical protein